MPVSGRFSAPGSVTVCLSPARIDASGDPLDALCFGKSFGKRLPARRAGVFLGPRTASGGRGCGRRRHMKVPATGTLRSGPIGGRPRRAVTLERQITVRLWAKRDMAMSAQASGFSWTRGLITGLIVGGIFLACGAGPVLASGALVVAFGLGAAWRKIT